MTRDESASSPVFIVGLQRSGTGILLNLLQSHPEVCTVGGEVHEVLQAGRRNGESLWSSLLRRSRSLPIRFLQGEDAFLVNQWAPRRPLRPRSMTWIDRAFRESMLRARGVTENRYKSDGVPYTTEEIARSRFVTKLLQGLLFLTEEMMRVYPRARFVGMVRNGLALCESHIRRGTDPVEAATAWRVACDQMIRYADRYESFRLIRFEDMARDPISTFDEISRHSKLDPDRIQTIRWVAKKAIDAGGRHAGADGTAEQRLEWFPKSELPERFVRGVDSNQIRLLTDQQREMVLRVAGDTLKRLSYA
jgi:hypothetical protein